MLGFGYAVGDRNQTAGDVEKQMAKPKLTSAQKKTQEQVRTLVAEAKYGGHTTEKVDQLLTKAETLNKTLPR